MERYDHYILRKKMFSRKKWPFFGFLLLLILFFWFWPPKKPFSMPISKKSHECFLLDNKKWVLNFWSNLWNFAIFYFLWFFEIWKLDNFPFFQLFHFFQLCRPITFSFRLYSKNNGNKSCSLGDLQSNGVKKPLK